jgi:hypothetical protein
VWCSRQHAPPPSQHAPIRVSMLMIRLGTRPVIPNGARRSFPYASRPASPAARRGGSTRTARTPTRCRLGRGPATGPTAPPPPSRAGPNRWRAGHRAAIRREGGRGTAGGAGGAGGGQGVPWGRSRTERRSWADSTLTKRIPHRAAAAASSAPSPTATMSAAAPKRLTTSRKQASLPASREL